MKQIKLLLLLGALLNATYIDAATLNVFDKNDNSEVFLNKQYIGRGQVLNYDIDHGSHLLEIRLKKDVVYSEIIQVEKDEVKTVSTERFVESKSLLANKGSEKQELNRVMDSRGNFSLGLNLGSLTGIGIGVRSEKLGAELTTFYTSDYGYNYEVRGYYYISNKILKRMPASIYLTSGFGQASGDNYEKTHADIMIGIQYSMAQNQTSDSAWTNLWNGLFTSLLTLDNMYVNFDIGYGYGDINDTRYWYERVEKESISPVMRLGMKYYF